jgi:hypothetical protein
VTRIRGFIEELLNELDAALGRDRMNGLALPTLRRRPGGKKGGYRHGIASAS